MKTIYLLQDAGKVIGQYRSRVEAGIASDAYFEHCGVKPLLIVTKIIGFATR